MLGRVLLTSVCVLLSCGCTTPGHFGRNYVACGLSERTGLELGPEASACEPAIPEIVDASDGISEDEAVILGLWNNAAFQVLLADLNITRADLIQANQIGNPEVWSLFPVGVKAFEFALQVPLETIWLRPKRVAIAEVESQRVGERLVQDALNVIRDVRVAYADLVLAQDRLRLAQEGARLRGRIGELADARLRAGDASELEVSAARIDARLAQEEAARLAGDVELASHRLRFLLGIGITELPVDPVEPLEVPQCNLDADELVHEAIATRPDLLAAELAVAAAQRRARLARFDFITMVGTLPDPFALFRDLLWRFCY
jgi:cobalt-zinc-cadmium efflux system outer membrane protein